MWLMTDPEPHRSVTDERSNVFQSVKKQNLVETVLLLDWNAHFTTKFKRKAQKVAEQKFC
jgi:hypothetical protein